MIREIMFLLRMNAFSLSSMHNHFLSELERKTFAEDSFEDPQRRKGAEISRFCIFITFPLISNKCQTLKTLKEP